MSVRISVRRTLLWAVLLCIVVVVLAPLAVVVVVALTAPRQFAQEGVSVPDPWTLENIAAVLADPGILLIPAGITAAVAGVVCLTQTASSVLAAFAFARFDFPGRRLLFAVFLAAWLVPPVVTVLPLYLAFVRLGLAGTFAALVLPSAFASPYAVFLLRQWFAGIPAPLLDAATLDGATEWAILRRIVLPISRPAVATVILVIAVSTWNAYLWPRMIAGTRLPQVQVAIASLQTQFDANWTLVLAASGLALLPPVLATIALQHPFRRTIENHIEE